MARKSKPRATIIGTVALVVLGMAWALPTATATATDPAPIVLSPTVIVTIGFDDGTVDQFAASEPLRLHGMHATFFINSGPILAGDPDHMTVAQLRASPPSATRSAGTPSTTPTSSRSRRQTPGTRSATIAQR